MKKNRNSTKSILLVGLVLWVSLFSLPALAANFPQRAQNGYVTDKANILSSGTENSITQKGEALHTATGFDLLVVTVDFTDELDTSVYATQLFNKWGSQKGGEDIGMLLLLAVGEDDYYLAQSANSEEFFTPGDLKEILTTHLLDDFDSQQYESGVMNTYDALAGEIQNRVMPLKTGEAKDELVPLTGAANPDTKGYQSNYIDDQVGVLSQETIDYIEKKNNDKSDGQTRLFVQVIADAQGEDLSQLTTAVFNEFELAPSDILLLVTLEEGAHAIQGGAIKGVITDRVLGDVLNSELADPYDQGDYDKGIYKTAQRLFKLTKKVNLNYVASGAVANTPTTEEEKGSFGFGSLVVLILVIIFINALFKGRRSRRYYRGSPYVPPVRRTVFFPFFGGWRNRHHHHNPPPPRGGGPGSWGGSSGSGSSSGGGFSRGSGSGGFTGGSSGRSSGSSSSGRSSGGGFSRGSGSSSGGGFSRGSGSGRSSGGSSRGSSSGRSSGGGFSRGSGAGKR